MNHRRDLRDLKISRIHFLNLWKERAPDGVFEIGDVCDKGDEKPTSVLGDEEPTSVDMVVGTQTGSTVGLNRLGEGEGEEGVGVGVGGMMKDVLVRGGEAKVKSGNGSSLERRGGPPRMKGRREEMGTRYEFVVGIQPLGGEERACFTQSLRY